MKSELSFLMDLFLNEEVPAPIKKLVASRIKEVEKYLTAEPIVPRGTVTSGYAQVRQKDVDESSMMIRGVTTVTQAPSMMKIIERNPDVLPPTPVTPAAAAALQQRAMLINNRTKEKPEDGRSGPRKI